MNIKLTIAALALLIPLAVASPPARADNLSANDRTELALAVAVYCMGKEDACGHKSVAAIESSCNGLGSLHQLLQCARLVMAMRDGEDRTVPRAEPTAEPQQPPPTGELPQKGWRVQKSPTAAWRVLEPR